MKSRLVSLNLFLLLLVVGAGWILRNRWVESREREAAVARQQVKPLPPPAIAPIAKPLAAKPTNYVDVAQKMLFVRDRNPNVILKPPPAPPPPPPMPALPSAYGVVNIGQGPMVIMAEKSGAQHKSYKAGDKVGEFKLLAFNNSEVLLEWNGERIKKRIDELKDRTTPPPAAEPTPVAAPASNAAGSTSLAPSKPGPSDVAAGRGSKACVASDTSPAGTVADGMKKVVMETPFGKSCRWDPVQ
ncbi:MAG TPA: hypothetical protein VMZ52_08595 [Bryobacteraceae bacterium]|nr:hypothetical protein [Bryobacteraceae bacterium]